MPYSNVWDLTRPQGTLRVRQIDDEVRAFRLDMEERFEDLFGMDMLGDPLVPTRIARVLFIQALQVYDTLDIMGVQGVTALLDFDLGSRKSFILGANLTVTLQNMIPGQTYTLFAVQDATGGRTITFPSTVRITGGGTLGTPVMNMTPNTLTMFGLTALSSTIAVGTMLETGVNVS